MQIFTLILTMAFLNMITFAQVNQPSAPSQNTSQQPATERRIHDLPRPQPKPPKLTLQRALKIIENHIEKEKIDLSSYYLAEARWVLYGGEGDVKEPRWLFRWVHVGGALGNYATFTVSMDGKINTIGSM